MQGLEGLKVGVGFTGSFCTFKRMLTVLEDMVHSGAEVYPIFSANVATMDNRFFRASDFVGKVQEITGRKGFFTIQEAEPIGPSGMFDVMLIAPCTGNTLAKLANGITDTAVLMAAKAHLRNEKPLVLAVSTNDALGINLKNIGMLMNSKYIYFVPFGQDDSRNKPCSLVAHLSEIPETLLAAMQGRQIQPLVVEYHS